MSNTLTILKDVVEIPSHGQSNPDREKDLANYLKSYVNSSFPEMETIEVISSGYTNLFCLGSRSPKVLLACHMDTVPPSKPGHTCIIQDGDRLYGLGTKDMKGGIVSSLLSLEKITNLEDVGLIFYSDEEYTQKGIVATAKVLPDYLESTPKLIISPESRFNIGYGARGIIVIDLEVKGLKAHSARPHLGKDAIFGLFESLIELRQSISKVTELGETTLNVTKVEGGLVAPDGSLTSHAGSIPDTIRAQISIRNSQVDLTAEKIIDVLSELLGAKGLNIVSANVLSDHGARYVPVLKVQKLIDFASTSANINIELGDPKLAGYNDAQLLGIELSTEVINFGPAGDQNHTADEWVSLQSIEQVADIFALWVNNIDSLV